MTNAVGSAVTDPFIHDVVMTRTSFGTVAAWNALAGAVPVNPPLLKGAVDQSLSETGEARLTDLVARFASLLDDLVAQASPRWESHDLILGGTGSSRLALTIPLLKFDLRVVERSRLLLAPGTM